jgi:hypothetical protein
MDQSKIINKHAPTELDKIDLQNKVIESSGQSIIKSLLLLLKRKVYAIWKLSEPFSNINSYSEIDPFFIKNFLKISHPYGITLSVDEIGSSCQIAQNSTIGTNGKF